MSIKSRRPPRGNTQRNSGGTRRSSVSGFAAQVETPPGTSEPAPPVPDVSNTPDALNAVETNASFGTDVPSNGNAHDSAPDSSTRGREERSTRRGRDRGNGWAKGRPSLPPRSRREASKVHDADERRSASDPQGVTSSPSSIAPSSNRGSRSGDGFVDAVPASAGDRSHVDIDERFFSEGVKSEGEFVARKPLSIPPSEQEEDFDPKLLLKMHPDVRARRAKYAPFVKWVVLGAVLLGLLAGGELHFHIFKVRIWGTGCQGRLGARRPPPRW